MHMTGANIKVSSNNFKFYFLLFKKRSVAVFKKKGSFLSIRIKITDLKTLTY